MTSTRKGFLPFFVAEGRKIRSDSASGGHPPAPREIAGVTNGAARATAANQENAAVAENGSNAPAAGAPAPAAAASSLAPTSDVD